MADNRNDNNDNLCCISTLATMEIENKDVRGGEDGWVECLRGMSPRSEGGIKCDDPGNGTTELVLGTLLGRNS